MEGRGETTTATGATTIKGHSHLTASKTAVATAIKGVATRAAIRGLHLQLLGSQCGGEVHLADVAMVGMTIEAVMKDSETIGMRVGAVAEEDMEVTPAMAGATLGTIGVHPHQPDREVHHRRQLHRHTVATRGGVMDHLPRAAAVVATATRRAITSRAHRTGVVALRHPGVAAPTVEALMVEAPMAALVGVVTGVDSTVFLCQDGLPRLRTAQHRCSGYCFGSGWHV